MGLKWAKPDQTFLFHQKPLPDQSTRPQGEFVGVSGKASNNLQKLKNRIINFRVTDEELARLKSASNQHGARCMSDFARTIMLRTVAESGSARDGHGQIEEKIHSLDGRLTSVESDLSRVIKCAACLGAVCRKAED